MAEQLALLAWVELAERVYEGFARLAEVDPAAADLAVARRLVLIEGSVIWAESAAAAQVSAEESSAERALVELVWAVPFFWWPASVLASAERQAASVLAGILVLAETEVPAEVLVADWGQPRPEVPGYFCILGSGSFYQLARADTEVDCCNFHNWPGSCWFLICRHNKRSRLGPELAPRKSQPHSNSVLMKRGLQLVQSASRLENQNHKLYSRNN